VNLNRRDCTSGRRFDPGSLGFPLENRSANSREKGKGAVTCTGAGKKGEPGHTGTGINTSCSLAASLLPRLGAVAISVTTTSLG